MTVCTDTRVPVVHPALATRFSPVAFDFAAAVTDEQVDSLLDAARLAPSAGNAQPWSFIVARRGDAVHRRLVPHLARSASLWALDASVLIVNLAHVFVEGTEDMEYSEFARYDLGQAVAHMTIQGLSIGFDAHQFRAFNRDAIATEFSVASHWEVATMTAFGRAARTSAAAKSPATNRERLSRRAITWDRA